MQDNPMNPLQSPESLAQKCEDFVEEQRLLSEQAAEKAV
jgi:hypothetical protein